MKKYFYLIIAILALCVGTNKSMAQGCVAVRQMGGINPLSTSGYTLPKGDFQIGVSYRYFHSFRHFVGTDEKEFRQYTQGGFDENGKERGNAVNIYSHAVDLNISYALSDRMQINIALPYVNNERSQVLATKLGEKIIIDGEEKTQTLEGTRYSVYARGLGDIRISTNYWLFDPKKASKGNLMVGLGLKLNNGSHDETDESLALDDNKQVVKRTVVMDQAIQPGDGGVGFSIELQGFTQLYKGLYGFANGYYLFNPRESNGTFKSAPKAGLEGYNIYASPDQYFVRAGFMAPLLKGHNLTASLAGRFEGIPAYDVFGGQVAYRRPGYVVAVEPGLSYRIGKHSVSVFVPVNFVRNRIQSAADREDSKLQNKHIQGDAAFADYSISINYSYRLGKIFGQKSSMKSQNVIN